MKRIKISLSDSTVELLEAVSAKKNLSKSNYICLLIQNDLNRKSMSSDSKLLEVLSDIDTDLRALICRDEIDGVEKLKILQYAKDIKEILSKGGCEDGICQ